MGIEVGTALLIGGLVSGGIGAFNAVQGASAAHDASQQQIDATNAALALQQRVYIDQQRNQYPFLSAGQKAVTRLSGLMGLGDLGSFQEPSTVSLGPAGPPPLSSLPHSGTPETPTTPPHSGTPAPAPPLVAVPRPGTQNPPPFPSLPHAGTPAPPPPGSAVPRPGGPGGVAQPRPRALSSIGGPDDASQSGGYSVTDPNGMTHTFPTQVQLAAFRQQVGL